MLGTPLSIEVPFVDPNELLPALPQEGLLFLDSSRNDVTLGRYSFLAFSPFELVTCRDHQLFLNNQPWAQTLFDYLRERLSLYASECLPDYPPFQGGIAGVLGYELSSYVEILPQAKQNDQDFPDTILGCYDLVMAWDHHLGKAWIFSNGFPYLDTKARESHAKQRLDWAITLINTRREKQPEYCKVEAHSIHSTFSPESYAQAVERAIEYIRSGDIFEVNLSQRFSCLLPNDFDSQSLYSKLRKVNPAPFSAFFRYGHYTIASASPERFLKLSGDYVETRPIKGTRKRSHDPQEDARLSEELLTSEKDRAENIMIVDLMRNDLSRVCLPHTVQVTQLCGLESFATVHHLVSAVEGKLMPEKNAIDLIEATFPGGSITGAPKIRAMEIIAEIEPTVRGPYCGSIGYIGFNNQMDLSITIRTFVMAGQHLSFHAGGAVTIDSCPNMEYEETLAKAAALQTALIA